MKKTIVLLVIGLSLVLLLGVNGPRPGVHDPNSECHWTQGSISRENILDYDIIVADKPEALADQVKGRLKDRKDKWIPLGGISVNNSKYYQAIVKITQ